MHGLGRLLYVLFLASLLAIPILVDSGNCHPNDTDPPTITDVSCILIGETRFTLEWRTDEPAIGGVEWGIDGNLGNCTFEEGNYTTDHFLNITGLERGTVYSVRIFARDPSNNTGFSEIWTVGTYPIGGQERFWSRFWSEYVWILLVVMVALVILVPAAVLLLHRRKEGS